MNKFRFESIYERRLWEKELRGSALILNTICTFSFEKKHGNLKHDVGTTSESEGEADLVELV